MRQIFPGLDPKNYVQHPLHSSERMWPETNCYIDLWIEVLASKGLAPEAMFGFTLTQDFEGDQFTFFKVPLEDLEALYGIRATELAIFDRVENHIEAQLERGRICLIEMDSFYMPDTHGVGYQKEHGKTTVAINRLDLAPFLPYTEFAKFADSDPSPAHIRKTAERLLRFHFSRRPSANPVRAFSAVFPAQVEKVADRPFGFFHKYAFNTLRQLGANFELAASHLEWLDRQGFSEAREHALRISEVAKTVQFQLARAVTRRKFDALASVLDPAADAWDGLMESLAAKLSDASEAA